MFIGVGLWQPEPEPLASIREALVEKSAAWRKAVATEDFVSRFKLGGESLKRPPRGVDPEHPLIEDIKREDFIASTELDEKAVFSPRFA